MYSVYKCTNLLNNKSYIGITKRDVTSRFVNHFSEAFNPNSDKYDTPFKQAIRKYGKNNFSIEIINQSNDIDEAYELERYYITYYNTYCYQKNSQGYNATLGGDGCAIHLKNIAQVDVDNYQVINIYHSISEIENILNIHHISECLSDKLPTSGGYCWVDADYYNNLNTQEQQDFINLKLKRIVQLDTNNNFIRIWNSALEAARTLGISDSNIVSSYNGRRRYAGGYVWRTYGDYINNTQPFYQKRQVVQRDKEYNIIQIYNTIKDAAEQNDVIPQVLGRHINTDKLYLNYYWNKEYVI